MPKAQTTAVFSGMGAKKLPLLFKPLWYGFSLDVASVAKWCLTLVTLWTIPCQALLSVGFPKQEYWGGLPFLFAGDLPDSSIEPEFPALQVVSCISGTFFTTEPPGKPWIFPFTYNQKCLN